MTPKVTDPSERTPDLARTSPNEPVDWLDEVIAYIRVPEHTFLEAKEYMQSKLDSQKAELIKEIREQIGRTLLDSELTYTIDMMTSGDRKTAIYPKQQGLVDELIIAENKILAKIERNSEI